MSARKTRSSTNLTPKEEIKRRKAEGEERNTLSEHSDFYESEEEEKPTYDLRALKLARRKEELAEERKKHPLSNKQVRSSSLFLTWFGSNMSVLIGVGSAAPQACCSSSEAGGGGLDEAGHGGRGAQGGAEEN